MQFQKLWSWKKLFSQNFNENQESIATNIVGSSLIKGNKVTSMEEYKASIGKNGHDWKLIIILKGLIFLSLPYISEINHCRNSEYDREICCRTK